jgi:hypothetical protein
MIRLTEENNIQLILVRLKTLIPDPQDAKAIERYIGELSQYLNSQNVLFLDYGNDPRLISSYYADSLHLTREGEALFTEMLAEELKKELGK